VVTKITDHEDRAEARLPEQFKGKELMVALVRAIANEVQDIEDAVFPMLQLLDIDTMIGAQLDGIGDILTEPRAGQNDADYRLALSAKAARITASGTPEQIIERYLSLTGASAVEYTPQYPAKFMLDGTGGESPDNLLSALTLATPVGVGIIVSDPYELTGSTYDGDDLILTGSTYDGDIFEVGWGDT
jgi:hypothetical protein